MCIRDSCGPVVGPAGEVGPRGVQGPNGTDGVDGAAVLSGPRPPQSNDGVDGDHWIDLSSTTYGFYKKASGTWTKLAELRTQQLGRNAQQGAAVGGGGGGGGSGELQNTRTLPLINGGETIRKTAKNRGLPPAPGQLASQEDANLYFLNCLTTQDVTVSDSVPRPPYQICLLYTSPSPRDRTRSRMPSSA